MRQILKLWWAENYGSSFYLLFTVFCVKDHSIDTGHVKHRGILSALM